MTQRETHIIDRETVAVFEESEKIKSYDHVEHEYILSISAQGKTIEYPISEELFEMITEDFNHIYE